MTRRVWSDNANPHSNYANKNIFLSILNILYFKTNLKC